MPPTGRRPRLTTPLDAAARRARGALARSFRYFRPTTRLLFGFFVLVVLSTLLLARTRSALPAAGAYSEGDVVTADVIAPADFTAEDAAETARRREAAREASPTVWNYDPSPSEEAVRALRAAWSLLRRQAEARAQAGGDNNANGNQQGQANANAPAAELLWPGPADDRAAAARAVAAHRFETGSLETLARVLREAGGGYVFAEGEAGLVRPRLRVVDARTGAPAEVNSEQVRFVSLGAARESLRGRVAELPGWKTAEKEALTGALLPLLGPTVRFDEAATEAARAASLRATPPAVVTLKRNQVLAREGDAVTPHMLGQFAAVREYGRSERRPQHFIGMLLFVAALYWAAWRFTEYRSTITTLPLSAPRAFALLGLAALVQLALMRVGFAVAESIASESTHAPTNDAALWTFAIPFAASALLVALLVDTQLALIAAVLTALFAGLLCGSSIERICI